MVTVLSLCSALYFIFALYLFFQRHREQVTDHNGNWPFVSIIIAARNEGDKIASCLNSLVNLTYPREKTEIIIVNDDSDDQTETIVQHYCQQFCHIEKFNLSRREKVLPGKAGAVLAGIEQSSGEFIFLTDADCEVTPTWVETLIEAFTPSVGLVGGYTLLNEKKPHPTYWQKSQEVDWLYLLTIAAAAADMGRPLSWMGNNLAFRRAAYDQVGGYRNLGHSLIEDFALIDAIARKTEWQISFLCSPAAMVFSRPAIEFRQLYNQRKRWGMGIRLVRPFGKILMSCSFICHTLIFINIFLNPIPAILSALGIFFADLLLCLKSIHRLHRWRMLYYFPGFQMMYFVYSIVLPFVLLFSRKIEWKNETYKKKIK